MNAAEPTARPTVETPPVLLLSGPTAVGKSALALKVLEHLECSEGGWRGAEIVSVDSAQVYRGMDIGTAKPDAALRARVPHHLIDLLDPAERYSAARFADDALAAVAAIRSRGHVPILVGGTLLYFRALLGGLSPLPAADATLRARLSEDAARFGWPALHARLAAADPCTAARLHPNDAQRVQRALEILELSGEPPSRLQRGGSASALGRYLAFALLPADRAALHRAIEQRFAQMMAQGLLEEVRGLHARSDLDPGLPALRAVGYRQLWAHLDGRIVLDEAVRQAVAATRQYAKRQLTWLRSETGFDFIDPVEPDPLFTVLKALKAASKAAL